MTTKKSKRKSKSSYNISSLNVVKLTNSNDKDAYNPIVHSIGVAKLIYD